MSSEQVKRPGFSLDAARYRGSARNVTPEEEAEIESYQRQIAGFAAKNPGAVRHEQHPDGHLTTYKLGEERNYNIDHKIFVDELTVSISSTRKFGPNDSTVTAKLRISPYAKPLISVDQINEPIQGASLGFGYKASCAELGHILHVFENGSRQDPRVNSWKSLAQN